MSQVMIIGANGPLRELIEINLKAALKLDVIPRTDEAEAKELLTILPSIPIIISLPNSHISNELQEIYSHIKFLKISEPEDWESIIPRVAKKLGLELENIELQKVPQFISTPIRFFYNLTSTPCDVFIQIKKEGAKFQYVKRIHSMDSFTSEQLDKYFDQGLLNFYILSEDERRFTTHLSNALLAQLNLKKKTIHSEINALDQGYQFIAQQVQRNGFSSATTDLVDKMVRTMATSLKRNPQLSIFFYQVMNSKTSYFYQHAHIGTVISLEILKDLKLFTNEKALTFCYANFFKDITIATSGLSAEFAKIDSEEELKAYNFNEGVKAHIRDHALDAAVIIRRNPLAPIETDRLIKNHHGSNAGRGFPSRNLNLMMDSKVMVIACEFAKEMLDFLNLKEGQEAKPIIPKLSMKYQDREYQRIITALDQILKRGQSSVSKQQSM